MYALAGPLAFIIRPIYNFIDNYGFTLIIVTILIKLLTIPFTIKSQKNMAKTQMIQPEINRLQEKYKNDKNKLAIEMQKIYKEYDVNPMGGCLPLLIQMFILFGFIGVIYHPFQYILQMSKEEISALAESLGHPSNTQEMYLWGLEGIKDNLKELGFGTINFDFFGIDLTKIPKNDMYNLTVWIFPALATIATYFSGYMTKVQQNAASGGKVNEQVQQTNNMMTTIMPIMTAVFTVTMPIGMSLYWFVSTAFQLIQQAIMNNTVNEKIKTQVYEKQEELKLEKAKKKKR